MFDENEILEQRFTYIYQQHFQEVYRFLICFSGNKNDAEDLTQEVFLQVAASLESFNGKAQMKTWIIAIAKNVARRWYRKRRIKELLSTSFFKRLTTKDGIPDLELHHKENHSELMKALQTLPPTYRTVLILRFIKDYSIKEVAEILSCPESKAKTDYYRALKKLQHQMEKHGEGEWAYEQLR